MAKDNIKNYIAQSTLNSELLPTQHNGRRIPLHLTEKTEKELQKLIEEKQLIKLSKNSDESFVSPEEIAVKSHQCIKIALD